MFKKNVLVSLIFIIGATVIAFNSAMAETWNIEEVDAPKYFNMLNSRAIALDNKGHPHIAYGYEHLYHAYFDGTGWVYETVDLDHLVGNNASIAIDSNNYIHISYSSGGYSGRLKYATNSSGSWVTETVQITGYSMSRDNSIAVDSNNNVHISFYDMYSVSYNLRYTTNASGSWVTVTVDDNGDVGDCNSIAVDSNNKVHICYYDNDNYDLKYATNATGSWVSEIIGDTMYKHNSITIDMDNHIHIGYGCSLGFELRHTTNASGSWVTETVEISSQGWVTFPSLSIDSNNHVHISYSNLLSAQKKSPFRYLL
jgi:hypothetical protein